MSRNPPSHFHSTNQRIKMKQQIDIRKYASFFHDGSLFSITIQESTILMKMCSAEITPEYIKENIELSKAHTLMGILHIQGVRDVQISSNILLDNLMKTFDEGTILDFEFLGNCLKLGILWENYSPKPRTNEFSVITIEADDIWWENIPDHEI